MISEADKFDPELLAKLPQDEQIQSIELRLTYDKHAPSSFLRDWTLKTFMKAEGKLTFQELEGLKRDDSNPLRSIALQNTIKTSLLTVKIKNIYIIVIDKLLVVIMC